jgi:Ca2+-binding RTX toxin-like protein/lysophospholipase L1-like esterase
MSGEISKAPSPVHRHHHIAVLPSLADLEIMTAEVRIMRRTVGVVVVLFAVAALLQAPTSAQVSDPEPVDIEVHPFDEPREPDGFDQCVATVEGVDEDGRFEMSEERCYRSYGEVLAESSATSAAAASLVSPTQASAEDLFAAGIIGTHYDGSSFDGPSISITGVDCLGGGLAFANGGQWDNRISSTLNGCPVILHWDEGEPGPPPYGGDTEASVGKGKVLTRLSNRVTGITYLGEGSGISLELSPTSSTRRVEDRVVSFRAKASAGSELMQFEVSSGPNAGQKGYCTDSLARLPVIPLATGRCRANAGGIVSWAYSNASQQTGLDTVLAFVDRNGNGSIDAGEPAEIAEVTWFDGAGAYAALGDSFASGEGVEPFFDTDNSCHRSEFAYSQMVERPYTSERTLADEGVVSFFACSGASTYHITNDVPGLGEDERRRAATDGAGPGIDNEPEQDVSLAGLGRVDLVTLNIGGNDALWTEAISECVFEGAYDCTDPSNSFPGTQTQFTEFVDQRLPLVLDRQRAVVQRVHQLAPEAAIVLVGYPFLFPQSADEQNCGKLDPNLPTNKFHLSNAEQNYFRSIQQSFDNDMANMADAEGVWFAPTQARSSGHEVCGHAGEWINALVLSYYCIPLGPCVPSGKGDATFHPNKKGQEGFALIVNDFLRARRADGAPLNAGGFPVREPQGIASLAAPLAAVAEEPPVELQQATVEGAGQCGSDAVFSPGAAFTVTASGFAPDSTVDLEVSYGNVPGVETATATADNAGVASAALTIPSNVGEAPWMAIATGEGPLGTPVAAYSAPLLTSGSHPCVAPDNASTSLDTPVAIDVLANDDTGFDASSLTITESPSYGDANAGNGVITYTPRPGTSGTDTLTYTVCETDATGAATWCDEATVTVVTTVVCTITGTGGDDAIEGTDSDDVICAGDGHDVINAAGGADIVLAGPGDDAVYGGTGNDTLYGGPGADFIAGQAGDDTVTAGDDPADVGIEIADSNTPTILVASPTSGATYLLGETVVADYSCDDATSGVFACDAATPNGSPLDTSTPGPKTLTVSAADHAGNLAATVVTYVVIDPNNTPPVANDDVEAIPRNTTVNIDVLDNDSDVDDNLDPASVSIISSTPDATITANNDGTVDYAPPQSFEGTDTFTYQVCDTSAACDTATVTITVGNASCTIVGTEGNDTINGTPGNDVICGGGGNDTINAGGGNDTINAGTGDDTINAGGGDDLVLGQQGADTIEGGAGADRLHGGHGPDTIRGDNGTDEIHGGPGRDDLAGGAGGDTIYGGDGTDVINGNAGNDTLRARAGNDSLYGGDDNDVLYGGKDNDALFGRAGDDTLYGRGGADTLQGGAGTDSANGGAGFDTCRAETLNRCET